MTRPKAIATGRRKPGDERLNNLCAEEPTYCDARPSCPNLLATGNRLCYEGESAHNPTFKAKPVTAVTVTV